MREAKGVRALYPTLMPGAIGINLPFLQVAEMAAASGFQGINLDLGAVDRLGAGQVKETLQRLGIRPGSFVLPVDFRGSASQYQSGLKRLPHLAKLAADVGCLRCSIWILSWSDELSFVDNFNFHRERLAPAAAILRDQGISLGLEFLGPKTMRAGQRYEFIHTMDGMMELASAIGSNVGLLLDAWHWYTSHASVGDIERLRAQDVVDVHVNDAPPGLSVDEQIDHVRCLPGETGVIDIVGFLNALKKIGYDGPVTPEPFSQRVSSLPPEEALRETAASMQQIWIAAGLAA